MARMLVNMGREMLGAAVAKKPFTVKSRKKKRRDKQISLTSSRGEQRFQATRKTFNLEFTSIRVTFFTFSAAEGY